MSRDTPRDTFHHNLPFSTAICGNLRQYICNMSAICLQYVCNIHNVHDLCQAHETPLISTAKISVTLTAPGQTNDNFPCPAWKIAIGSLTTSALAALATYQPVLPLMIFLLLLLSLVS